MTESSINEQGPWNREIPGAEYGQLWAHLQGTWWNGLIFMSIHFAHSILRTSFSLQEIPLLNCYKPPEFLPLAS